MSRVDRSCKGFIMLKMNEYLNIQEAADYLGVALITLLRWEKKKKIEVARNPLNNYRMYKISDLKKILRDIKSKKST